MIKPLPLALLAILLVSRSTTCAETEKPPTRIRIGVDIRLGFQACMESWLPLTEYLSKAIPEHRFVVIPLASHEDVVGALTKGDLDFVALDPAMEILVQDQYGAVPLVTMTETSSEETKRRSPNDACSGTLIRRADRSDIRDIRDVRGKRISAVKPWSLTGWLAQWGLLKKHGVDPQRDLKQVVFEGTNGKVARSVLDGSADIGAIDAEMLLHLVRCNQVSAASLYFFDREGRAVPLTSGQDPSSTDAYPGRVLSKADSVPDELAQRVADALTKQTVEIQMDHVPYQIGSTAACNDTKVRRLLQVLMGPRFAESPGFPLPRENPAWLAPTLIVVGELIAFALLVILVRNRFRRREARLTEHLEDTRKELLEVRAERQRIDAILALAGCGIDIVDDSNEIIYADSALEREYGDWHGRKCHEYFCGRQTPCDGCRRPHPSDGTGHTVLDLDCSESASRDDPHARVHYIEGESTRMIGIPFSDEGGRWLFARIHFPLMAFSTSERR